MIESSLDPSRCPLCRELNQCGMVDGTGTCWCFDAPNTLQGLDLLSRESAGLACLCAHCLSGVRTLPIALTRVRDCIRAWR